MEVKILCFVLMRLSLIRNCIVMHSFRNLYFNVECWFKNVFMNSLFLPLLLYQRDRDN